MQVYFFVNCCFDPNHETMTQMKNSLPTIIISLAAGFAGGLGSQFLFDEGHIENALSEPEVSHINNPFAVKSPDATYADTSDRASTSTDEIKALKQHIIQLENQLDEIKSSLAASGNAPAESTQAAGIFRPVQPDQEKLVDAGVNPDIAADILRRMSQQEYRRLELQNLISRSSGENRRIYQNELRELNRNRLSLRTELGDDLYDNYLYSSGQSNRVKVSSIMSGSPAESAGFKTDDVILSYDGKKILNWPDIRKFTRQGDIGSYTNIDILRDGERISLMVPRGTLGVQLDAVRVDPQL